MKNIFILLLFIAVVLTSCSKSEEPEEKYLITASKSSTVQKEMMQTVMALIPDYAKYATLLKTDVSLFRVSYTTEYPKGKKINASGVLIIPDDFNTNYPTVVYTHGSIYKNEAPSLAINNLLSFPKEVALCIVMSSSFNCAVLMPDYVGYGDSESIPHPYMHAESLGQASLDLIRASREYVATPEVALPFNNHIFITGYSEGGYAAVALQKKIQETTNSGLQVVKTLAGAGAYDHVVFAKEFLQQDIELNRHFVSSYLWVIGMYKTDFAYSKNYDQIFSEQDNTLLQSTNYNLAYFAPENLAINTNPWSLFKPEFRNGVINGTDTEMLQILKENSLIDFTPRDSLIFVHGTADTWVYPVNTLNAYNTMSAKGCKVKLYEYPDGNHETTLPVFLDILLGRLRMN